VTQVYGVGRDHYRGFEGALEAAPRHGEVETGLLRVEPGTSAGQPGGRVEDDPAPNGSEAHKRRTGGRLTAAHTGPQLGLARFVGRHYAGIVSPSRDSSAWCDGSPQ
jgi:hypothetical protein